MTYCVSGHDGHRKRSRGTIGEDGPLNEIWELNTIQQQMSLVHWLVSLYDIRKPERQCKNSNTVVPSHKPPQVIFKGAAPVREIRIPFSTEMPARAGFEPSQLRVI